MWSPALVHWPSEHQRRAQLAAAGIPRLLILAEGTPIPDDVGEDEDWVRLPASEQDVDARLRNLEARFSGALQLEDQVLRSSRGQIRLTRREADVMVLFLGRRGHLGALPDIVAAIGGSAGASGRQVHDTIHRLRGRIRPIGLDVFAAPRRGYTLGLRIDDSDPE
jgi:DNA-binding response OmpR family regulator